jgi:hypothetical protein
MKKAIVHLFVAGILTIPVGAYAQNQDNQAHRNEFRQRVKAHRQQQKKENKEFHKTLKELAPEERTAKIIRHHEEQFGENLAFGGQMYEKRVSKIRDRLVGSNKLSDAQKDEIMDLTEEQYQDRISFRKEQHQENISFINDLAGQTELSKEERKERVKSHREAQKKENKSFRESQKSKGKSYRQSIRLSFKDNSKKNDR